VSYVRDRYHATEGLILRLFMQFSQNGRLVDPESFGSVVISSEHDTSLVLATFNSPIRYSIGYYFVEWRVPNSIVGDPYYDTLFDELVNQRLERNFRDTWNNITINGASFTTFGNFYVAPEEAEIEFDVRNILRFQFQLVKDQLPKGSKDYISIQAIELNGRLAPGLSGWPDGQMAIKMGESMVRNWENALHQGNLNEYAIFVDTDGLKIGPYFAKLRFDIPETTSKRAAQLTGTRALTDGYAPAPGQDQILALNIDGQRHDIRFSSNATRGEVTGEGRSWGSAAKIESTFPSGGIVEPLITLNGVVVSLEIDGRNFSVTFTGTSLRVADVVSQINTASLAALGYSVAESFLDGTDVKIRLYSKTRGSWTYNETTPPTPPAEIAHVHIVSATSSLAEIGFTSGDQGWSTDIQATVTPLNANNVLKLAVKYTGSSANGYQQVNFPVGYWTDTDLINMLNGVTPFNRAILMSYDDALATYSFLPGFNTFTIESNLVGSSSTGQSTVTFITSGVGYPPTLADVITAMIAQFTLDNLDVTVDTTPVGSPPLNRIRLRSNAIGAASLLLVLSPDASSANTLLGFGEGDSSRGGDPLIGATARLNGNRIEFIGDNNGLTSTLQLASEADGSTINSLLGFDVGGSGIAYGSDAGPAYSYGRFGPAVPLTIDASTQASLRSEALGLLSLGGLTFDLQVDDARFTVNFTEVETYAKITSFLTLPAVSLSSAYKIYTTAAVGANHRLLSIIPNSLTVVGSGGGVYLPVQPVNLGSYPPLQIASMNALSVFYPYWAEVDSTLISPIGSYPPGTTIVGTTSGASTTCGPLIVSKGRSFACFDDLGSTTSFSSDILNERFHFNATGAELNQIAGILPGRLGAFHSAFTLFPYAPLPVPASGLNVYDGSGAGALQLARIEYNDGTWIVLSDVSHTFASGENVYIGTVILKTGPYILDEVIGVGAAAFTPTSFDLTANRLAIQANSGPMRTITFTPNTALALSDVITTINAAFSTFSDQAHAYSDAGKLAIESTVPGTSSQLGLYGIVSGGDANIPLGLPEGLVTVSKSSAPSDIGFIIVVLSANRIGEAISLHNLRGVVGAITQGGAQGTVLSVFGQSVATGGGTTSALVVYRLETPGTPFAAGIATFATAPPIARIISPLPLATAITAPVGAFVTEIGWYDDLTPEGQTGFTGYVNQPPSGDTMGLISLTSIALPSANSVLLVQQAGSAPTGFWPVSSASVSRSIVGTSAPLSASDIATQINTKALSSGVAYAPATSTPTGQLQLSSQTYGSNSRLLIWGGTAHDQLLLYPKTANPYSARVIAAEDTDVTDYTSVGAWEPGATVYVDTAPPAVPPAVLNYATITTAWSSPQIGSNLAVFGIGTVSFNPASPWPTATNIKETPGTGAIPGGRWAYGSVGRDGNDLWRIEANGTPYDTRIGSAISTYSDLASVLTSLLAGRASFSSSGFTDPDAVIRAASVGNSSSSTLRVLGFQENSTGPEGFGWGSARLQVANPRVPAFTLHEQLLLLEQTTYTPVPAWIAQVGAQIDGFSVLVGNPTGDQPNSAPPTYRLVGYLSGNVVNGNYVAPGLTCMVPAACWHRAFVRGEPISFTGGPGLDSVVFDTNTRDLVIRGGDGYAATPAYDVTRRIRFSLDPISGLGIYNQAELLDFLNLPRLGVAWVGAWPSTWVDASGPTLDDAQLVYQPDTGAGDLLVASEGSGTLRLAGWQCVLIRFTPIPGHVFNDRDYVRWRDPVGPGPWNYGWILKLTTIHALDVAVFLVHDGYIPPDDTFAVNNLTLPGNAGLCGDRWADNVRFMIGRNIEGYSRTGGPATCFDSLDVAAQLCIFGPNLSFAYVDGTALKVMDSWLPGAHETAEPHGEVFLHPTSETTAWYKLGFPAGSALTGLYHRVGGGHLDGLGGALAPEWGTDAAPPSLLAPVPVATNNWVTSNPNSTFRTRIDNEVSLPNDGWLAATLNATSAPTHMTLWEIIDTLNGFGSAYGIGATYPFQAQAGYNNLVLKVNGVALPSIIFTVGTTYSLDDVVSILNADASFAAVATAISLDGQLFLYTKLSGAGRSLQVLDYTGGSTINGWLGFPWEGITSTAVGNSYLAYGGIVRAAAVPSAYPAAGGQLRIASLRMQSSTQDSALEIDSLSDGSTANGSLGFSNDGAGPVFGKTNDLSYPLTGTGGLVDLINGYYGGLAVADAAGSYLRFTSLATGLDAVVEVLAETSWDVQNSLGLTPQTVSGTEFRTVAQTVVSPWLQFQVV